jgi:hypothetical protein
VSALLELCPPGIQQPFLQHSLRQQFQGDVDAAANWLLEVSPGQLAREQDAWAAQQQQHEAARREEEHARRMAKKQIVDK